MIKPEKKDGTVGKALEILELVADFERPVRFSELLARSDHPKATVYRFLQTLTNQGMLSYDESHQTYGIGLKVLRLAHAAWKNASLAPIASEIMDDLAKNVHETIHLAQMENGQVLFVDKRRSSSLFDTLAQTGRVAPAHCTGVGKVILAFMSPERLERALRQQAFVPYTKATHRDRDSLIGEFEEIRESGVAFDREEHEEGIISIAAPILLNNGKVVGSVSIATSTTRHSLSDLQDFKALLTETTKKIGDAATTWQFPSPN
ncbi:IclR family transcriptional regulator [Cognatishimia sp. SS12]|uniref:IclR family transcriptional regulator n=1 Tax=Cognatishimia sp. SS12 TaxID=2979465 RepID=UPI00232BE33E|nr:IclR family transcriptional regulator [Cognatishimia sp. SS12]MDC0737665.1 IclR family transcriptional regulator [Cognatishimia sp. SS12]